MDKRVSSRIWKPLLCVAFVAGWFGTCWHITDREMARYSEPRPISKSKHKLGTDTWEWVDGRVRPLGRFVVLGKHAGGEWRPLILFDYSAGLKETCRYDYGRNPQRMATEVTQYRGRPIVWGDETEGYDYYIPKGLRDEIVKEATAEYLEAQRKQLGYVQVDTLTVEILHDDDERKQQTVALTERGDGFAWTYVYEVKGTEVTPLRFGESTMLGAYVGGLKGLAVGVVAYVVLRACSALVRIARRRRSSTPELTE